MSDDWDTDPNFTAAPDSRGTGIAAVANPFISSQAATESTNPPVAVKIKRANSFDRFGGGGVRCVVCDKRAYAAEQRVIGANTYHKDCFRCTPCNTKQSLSSNIIMPPPNALFSLRNALTRIVFS